MHLRKLLYLSGHHISETVTTTEKVEGWEGGMVTRSSAAPSWTTVSPAKLVQHYVANPEELAALCSSATFTYLRQFSAEILTGLCKRIKI